jgi:3-deoxy-D-manno-octulosonic-acid transferase
MRALYTWLLRLLLPFILLRLAWRGFRNHGYWHRIAERFGFVVPVKVAKLVWIHAVSVGEARAAAPIVKALAEHYPHHSVLITTMTPTGSATVHSLFQDRVLHCYVPYDYPSAVRRFLERVRPQLALVMETEMWPNLFHACGARGIPLVMANVRMSERSMRGYLRVAGLARATLAQVTHIAAQSQADAERMIRIGADPARVHVTGSIKFELTLSGSTRERAEVLRAEWGRGRPVWIAASTHEGEDEAVLAAHRALRKRDRLADTLLVLVPRHPERFTQVAKLAERLGFTIARRKEHAGPLDRGVEVLIGDTMGELQLFLAASDAAFVGGSLVPTGGHNTLEASVVGKPVVFGPHMFNFSEIAAMTLERGAGVQIHSAAELAPAISDLLGSANRRDALGDAGRRMVEENRGALARTLKLIEQVLG